MEVRISSYDWQKNVASVMLKKEWWADSPGNVRIALLSNSYLDRMTIESAIKSIGLPKKCLTVVFSFYEIIERASQSGNF